MRRSVTISLILFTALVLSARTNAADIIFIESNGTNCDILILGELSDGDDKKFRNVVMNVLRGGCLLPRVNIYSPGGSYHAAIRIANDIQQLHATTIAPRFTEGRLEEQRLKIDPKTAKRSCDLIPGEDERVAGEEPKLRKYYEALGKSWQEGRRAPQYYVHLETYDPVSRFGDSRCTCGSACFFIWIAGVERHGDVLLVHRPYFDAKVYRELDMPTAREAFKALTQDARGFLEALDLPKEVLDKVFLTPSDKATYLSVDELGALRMTPFYEELKTAKCGPEPGPEAPLPSDVNDNKNYTGPYKNLTPEVRRHLARKVQRRICWDKAQEGERRRINADFIAKHGQH